MDFSNERYVRVYTRNSTTWMRMGWEAQCVFIQLLRIVDRAGVLDIEDMDPSDAVSLHTGMPIDLVKRGLARALELGSVERGATTLSVPRFIEAQECAQSDKQRQRESRERRRDMAKTATPVTNRDGLSHAVTPSHTPSQAVTLCCAVPSVPSKPEEELRASSLANASVPALAPANRTRALERPPVGEPPPELKPIAPTPRPWAVAWQVHQRVLGMAHLMEHPEKHRDWLEVLAREAQRRAGGSDHGPTYEKAVEALVRAWKGEDWVIKNRPPFSNIVRFIQREQMAPQATPKVDLSKLSDDEFFKLAGAS